MKHKRLSIPIKLTNVLDINKVLDKIEDNKKIFIVAPRQSGKTDFLANCLYLLDDAYLIPSNKSLQLKILQKYPELVDRVFCNKSDPEIPYKQIKFLLVDDFECIVNDMMNSKIDLLRRTNIATSSILNFDYFAMGKYGVFDEIIILNKLTISDMFLIK